LVKVAREPAPGFLPKDYVPELEGQASKEGEHWIKRNSPEFHGQTFTKTFIYGSYNGKLVFVEPMLTNAFLETRPNRIEPIELPAAYSKNTYFPNRYSVKYNRAQQEYSVSLDGLTLCPK